MMLCCRFGHGSSLYAQGDTFTIIGVTSLSRECFKHSVTVDPPADIVGVANILDGLVHFVTADGIVRQVAVEPGGKLVSVSKIGEVP